MAPAKLSRPPVVDLSDFDGRREDICRQLMTAATEIGFFYVKGHGLPQDAVDAAFLANQRLHSLPISRKKSLPKADWDKGELIFGSQQSGESGAPAWEAYAHVSDIHKEMEPAWPTEEECPGYRKAVLEYMAGMHPIAQKILSCFATGMGLPDDFFQQVTDRKRLDNHSYCQFNFYKSPKGHSWSPNTPRIFAHTDEALITLLHPSPGSVGLEVAAGKDGQAMDGKENGLYQIDDWMPCPHLPGHIVVNIGDALQLWSEGMLKSVFHRVRLPRQDEYQGDRYSLTYFIWPSLHHKMKGKSGNFPAFTMAEFMAQKGKLYVSAFDRDSDKYDEVSDSACAVGVPQQLHSVPIAA